MQANDGLPELMCVPCVLQVSRAFTFKQQCRRSDQTLRSFLGEVADNNNVENVEANTVEQSKIEDVIVEVASEDKARESPFQSSDEHLESELVLDVLPNSFEEETQFSPVAEDIQQQLSDTHFEIKLDVALGILSYTVK